MVFDLYHQYARAVPIILAIICFLVLRKGYVLLIITSALLIIWQIPLLLLLLSWLTGDGAPYMNFPLFVQLLCLVFGFYCLIKGIREFEQTRPY